MSFGFGMGFNLSGIGAYDPEAAIYSMFANNEQGVWYDPSDLSTMSQDSAGTTPAVVNSPVGLILDKRLGLPAGAELTTNGEFASGTGWVPMTTTFSGGQVLFSATANDTGPYQTSAAYTGGYYEITVVVASISSGAITATLGIGTPSTSNCVKITAPGTYTFRQANYSADTYLRVYSVGASTTAAVESVSVRRLGGNHATQATTASKPILRGTPAGANLVTNGTFDTDTDWTKGSGWTISAGAAHFATTGAASNLSQNIGLVTSRSYRTQITVTVSAGSLSVYTGAGGGGLARTITASGTYDIFSGAGADANLYLQASTTFSGSVDNVEVHDASADAVQAPYWLSFDGVDDFLSTAAIDFTGTDKMTVVAGARKNSDSAAGVIAELSVAATANNGTFLIDAPDVPAEQDYGFYARGSSTVAVAANGFPAPETAVLTLQVDTGAASNRAIARRNGVQLGTSGAAAIGAVNFGSYPLYIGRRAGTSLPFNGRLHQLIVRGAQTDAAKLAKAEAFTATKTGVSL